MAYAKTPKFDIEAIINHYANESLPPGRARHKILCLFHDETRPSMTVDTVKNTWRCFHGDDFGGDALDLIQAKEGCGFSESVTIAEAITGTTGRSVPEGAEDGAGRGRPVGLFGSGSSNKRAVNPRVQAGSRPRPRGL